MTRVYRRGVRIPLGSILVNFDGKEDEEPSGLVCIACVAIDSFGAFLFWESLGQQTSEEFYPEFGLMCEERRVGIPFVSKDGRFSDTPYFL